jgi:WhiB family redox-sensing transcriptional regulator
MLIDLLLEPADGPRWQEDAACQDVDPDVFFNEALIPTARRVCDGCPVREACLEYALEHERYGFWGGASETERKRMRRRLGRRVRQNPVRTRGVA